LRGCNTFRVRWLRLRGYVGAASRASSRHANKLYGLVCVVAVSKQALHPKLRYCGEAGDFVAVKRPRLRYRGIAGPTINTVDFDATAPNDWLDQCVARGAPGIAGPTIDTVDLDATALAFGNHAFGDSAFRDCACLWQPRLRRAHLATTPSATPLCGGRSPVADSTRCQCAAVRNSHSRV
jgi:hypothetical protein